MKYRMMLALLIASLLTACATRVPLTPTERVPAATATMKLGTDENSNTKVRVQVSHLAPPEKLRADLAVYTLWVRPVGAEQWENVGQMLIGEDREGHRDFSVPHRQFDLLVSAEANGEALAPSEFVVLRGQASQK